MIVSHERLTDLLLTPREDLECEVKNWLDLQGSNDDKATFAKAVLAIANHGGGFIILGHVETDTGAVEAEGRPATLDAYSQDQINGIVQNYCDPQFHCSVHFVRNSTEALFPVIVVPGGHRVPVRARRSGPNGNTVQNNAIYIRRPGPRSETPQSSQDWDDLLGRCFRNRRDEMFDQIRDLITGAVPQSEQQTESAGFDEWTATSRTRWNTLTETLPPTAEARLPHGRYCIAYEIIGDRKQVTAAQFPEILRASVVRHTGWPSFWYPTRAGITPYPINGAVECWLGGDTLEPSETKDAAHSDFWRISPEGRAFLMRGYQEDVGEIIRPGQAPLPPAAVFDITLPVWRVGEVLLHARSLAANLFEGAATIKFSVTFEGLSGRKLVSLSGRRSLWNDRMAHQDVINLSTHIDVRAIDPNLPEILHPLLSPLYALFDFFDLPMSLVVEEITRMRANNF